MIVDYEQQHVWLFIQGNWITLGSIQNYHKQREFLHFLQDAATNNLIVVFRSDMKEAEHENAKKKSELSSLSSKCKTLESQSRHKDKQLTKLNKKISMLEKNMQKYVQQVGNVN